MRAMLFAKYPAEAAKSLADFGPGTPESRSEFFEFNGVGILGDRVTVNYDLVGGFGWAELPTRQTPLLDEQAKEVLWNFVRNVAP